MSQKYILAELRKQIKRIYRCVPFHFSFRCDSIFSLRCAYINVVAFPWKLWKLPSIVELVYFTPCARVCRVMYWMFGCQHLSPPNEQSEKCRHTTLLVTIRFNFLHLCCETWSHDGTPASTNHFIWNFIVIIFIEKLVSIWMQFSGAFLIFRIRSFLPWQILLLRRSRSLQSMLNSSVLWSCVIIAQQQIKKMKWNCIYIH